MRTKKLLILIGSICLTLVLALPLVVACAGPGAGPAPEQAMEPQQWDLTIDSSAIDHFSDIQLQKAFAIVKERTNGLLDVRIIPHGQLPYKGEEWLRLVSSGKLAMTLASGGYHAGDYPIWGVIDVPYTFTNMVEKRMVWDAVRPIFRREMEKENIHILNYDPRFTQSFNTSKPVDVMDLKGMKIRSYSKAIAMIIEAMGGTAVPIAWPEVYTALERGVADGLLTGADGIYLTKMFEVAPYSYDVGLIHGIWVVTVNKELWDALPKSVQNIVYEELEAFQGLSLVWADAEMKNIYDLMLADGGKGHEKITDPAFFDMMLEKVTKPLMAEELAKTGAVGEEIVSAMEQALGKTLR